MSVYYRFTPSAETVLASPVKVHAITEDYDKFQWKRNWSIMKSLSQNYSWWITFNFQFAGDMIFELNDEYNDFCMEV